MPRPHAPKAVMQPPPVAEEPEEAPPKVIMSKAAKRKLKKPTPVVTTEMKEAAREELRTLRKHLRMVKSNGSRRKVAKEQEKRTREENGVAEAASGFDEDARPLKKGRRLESKEWIPPVQTLPNHMLPQYQLAKAETEAPAPKVTTASAPVEPAILRFFSDDKAKPSRKRTLEDEGW